MSTREKTASIKWETYLAFCQKYPVDTWQQCSPVVPGACRKLMKRLVASKRSNLFLNFEPGALFIVVFQLMSKFVDGYDVDDLMTYAAWYRILLYSEGCEAVRSRDDLRSLEKIFCKRCSMMEPLVLQTIDWDFCQFFDECDVDDAANTEQALSRKRKRQDT